ncbi:MAG: NlpC/P60 family protein [Stackebrandtia sp.]
MTVEVGHSAQVAVTAATLWTSPSTTQDTDRLALGSGTAIREWVAGMTREQRVKGLVDRALTQVLLGDEVIVDAVEDGWAKVVVQGQPSSLDERGYPGWIPERQLAVPAEPAGGKPHVVSATAIAVRDEPDGEVLIPGVSMGTRLNVLDEEHYRGWARVALPGPQQPGWVRMRDLSGAPGSPPPAASGRLDVIAVASQLLDVPYVWGGLTAYGVDCSSLVYLSFRQLGISLPRDAHDQAAATREITEDEAQPGDLYFFAHEGKQIHHIGLMTEPDDDGERTMVHADGNYGKVVHEPLTSERAETFVGVHKVFDD